MITESLLRSRNLKNQTNSICTRNFLGASDGPLSTMKPIFSFGFPVSWLRKNLSRLRMYISQNNSLKLLKTVSGSVDQMFTSVIAFPVLMTLTTLVCRIRIIYFRLILYVHKQMRHRRDHINPWLINRRSRVSKWIHVSLPAKVHCSYCLIV